MPIVDIKSRITEVAYFSNKVIAGTVGGDWHLNSLANASIDHVPVITLSTYLRVVWAQSYAVDRKWIAGISDELIFIQAKLAIFSILLSAVQNRSCWDFLTYSSL